MNSPIRFKLSLMMFLEFFIWGSWFVTLGTYLGTTLEVGGEGIGNAYTTQSWGAILAPFIVGLIADRYVAAQKLLGIIHLLGGGLLYIMGIQSDFDAFYPVLLLYMIIYMPTLALANSVALNQMKDPSSEFAGIRIFGSIGWILAGALIGYVFLWESKALLELTFYLAAASSVFLGLLSFFLPHTPPKSKGKAVRLSEMIGLDALHILRQRNYLVFFISSILICIPLAFYYSWTNLFLNETGMENAAGNMIFGQISEVLLLLLLPVFLKRFGLKWTLIVGMIAWVVRYTLFAYGDTGSGIWMLFLGIILHGICYDFFFVSGQIYTDLKAGEKHRSSAQGLITLATYGVGMLIGYQVSGYIVDQLSLEGGHQWSEIWMYPAGFAAVVLLLFAILFRNEKVNYKA